MAVASGQKLRASDLATASVSGIQSDSGTVATATYTPTRTGTSNIAGCAFIAPNSGNIMVMWSAGLSVTANFVLASFQIATGNVVGSGTVVQAANDNIQIQGTNTTETSAATFYPVSGLTPGAAYNVQLMYRTLSSGQTGTINRPRVAIVPLLA